MRKEIFGLTGATGSLGKRLAKQLDQHPNINVVPFGGDLRSESDIRDWVNGNSFNTIVLSGAIVPVERASESPAETFDVNGMSNLKIALRMQTLHGEAFRVCYVSSSHVYAPSEYPLSEKSPLGPRSIYGMSKIFGERLLQAAAGTFGFELLIARVFSFYSEDQHESHLYPTILRRIAKHPDADKPFALPGWNNVRDFSSADEAAAKVVRLATSSSTGIVNVGSGIAMSVGDFASQVYGSTLTFRKEDESANPTMLVADTSLFDEWMENSG